MLNVTDIQNSLDFYQKGLFFSIVSDPVSVNEWRWATIKSGDTELMLSESCHTSSLKQGIDPQTSNEWPTIFYFYPESVDKLHAHLQQCGYMPTKILNTIYGMREFSIQDPDGHLLSFGQDSTDHL